jgi:hypothetical protein
VGLLDSVMADDANFAFSDTDGFAEALTYRKAITNATRTVYGVVRRFSPAPGKTPTGMLMPMIRVTFPNNTTRGISTAEWKNGDAILIAERKGGEAKYMMLHWPPEPQAHDSGMVTFEVR